MALDRVAQFGVWTWPASGDTLPSVNNDFLGFAHLVGRRFALAVGTITTPQVATLDLNMQGWLALSATDLSIPAGTTQTVTLTCTGSRAAVGVNTALIRLLSNDVDAREVQVPVTFTVTTGDLRTRAINLNRTPAYEWDALEPADAVVDPAGPSSQTVRVRTGQTAIVAPVTVSGG